MYVCVWVTEVEEERSSVHWSTPQLAATSRPGQAQNRSRARALRLRVQRKKLGRSPCSSQAIRRERDWTWRSQDVYRMAAGSLSCSVAWLVAESYKFLFNDMCNWFVLEAFLNVWLEVYLQLRATSGSNIVKLCVGLLSFLLGRLYLRASSPLRCLPGEEHSRVVSVSSSYSL